ncbi:MAG: undecaprenyl/decaprenyl-phosphate alpha-N-acetylglucosaminyl 1-phosphate transferase [Candidatus Aureabacteria bacterium]|nr:undecaprenyl/decaprenyl-phosphate alpha-N-acetylglucosaminyl 1-phosphate transferase [Candidatus Auribacterota bacterium]
MILTYFIPFFLSLILSLIFTRVAITWSKRLNFMDVPGQISRKNHPQSTPLLGGTAVFCAFFSTLFLLLLTVFFLEDQMVRYIPDLTPFIRGSQKECKRLFFIFLGGSLVLLLGLKDDKNKEGMGPFMKLGILFLIALLLFYLNIRITLFIRTSILNYCLTFGWILFLTNSFNLLDNMDGLSAGTAVSCSLCMGIVSFVLGEYFITLYLLAFTGSLLGFLKYNFFGGRIFLGDSGALFIGYNLAVTAILESFFKQGKSPMFAVFIPVFIFAIPFYDTLSVVLIRLKNGKSIFRGDMNHFSHRLHRSGYSKRNAVVIIITLAFFISIVSLKLLHLRNQSLSFLYPLLLFLMTLIMLLGIELILKKMGRKITGSRTSQP